MLMLLKAIINQTPVQSLRRPVNWERIISVSDYQNVINLVYRGSLGLEKEMSEDCGLQFYQKYKKALLLYESYKNAEEVIIWQLEKHGIDALLLSDTSVRELYPMSEMASFGQIEILVDKANLAQVYRLMRDMDYEQEDDRLGNGNVYVRVPGIRIVFYGEIPIRNKVITKYFSGPIKKYLRMENYSEQNALRQSALGLAGVYSVKYRYIHILSDEEEYIYRVGRMVELYLAGVLKIRDILEFWLFQKVLDEEFPWKAVKELIEKAKWTDFAHQVDVLSSLWFGEGGRQQYGIALELEEYILLPGRENKHLDRVLLPQEKARLDFYRRDRKEEWLLKRREWRFPPREYMCQFFPILDKYPFLIIFCWGIRGYRIYSRMCAAKCQKVWLRLSVRFLDIKEKMKGLIRRREEEEEAPEELKEELSGSGFEPEAEEELPGTNQEPTEGQRETAFDSEHAERMRGTVLSSELPQDLQEMELDSELSEELWEMELDLELPEALQDVELNQETEEELPDTDLIRSRRGEDPKHE